MFKKTMTFDDLNGDEVTQTFYFNYNKKEIAEMLEFQQLEEKIARLQTPVEESGLSQQENNQMAYDIFQDLILDAYGEKGADNVTFVKTPALREYWKSHVAFVELIFEFLENAQLGAQFIENCLPPKMVSRAKEELKAESEGKLSSSTLSEMVQEADRRQKDPETRIEPGDISGLNADPEVQALAQEVASSKTKATEDLTEADILAMPDDEFKKLDVRRLSNDLIAVAFKRKMQV